MKRYQFVVLFICFGLAAGGPGSAAGEDSISLTYVQSSWLGIGSPIPGDLDLDRDVDFSDAFELSNNYGLTLGATWGQGDSDNDGDVDFTDAFSLTNSYGSVYATNPGVTGDGFLTLVYEMSTGKVSIEGPPSEQYKSLSINSASGKFNIGVAGWLSLPPGQVTFTDNTTTNQGFATLTALGGTFLPQNGYMIGQILNPNLTAAVLLQDLTIQYGIQGQIGTRLGDLLVISAPVLMPDLNMDGVVNIFDINLVSANWGGPGPAGDANKDGIVNIFDINLISANWTPTSTAVPEPSGALLLLLGALGLSLLYRQRSLRQPSRQYDRESARSE